MVCKQLTLIKRQLFPKEHQPFGYNIINKLLVIDLAVKNLRIHGNLC